MAVAAPIHVSPIRRGCEPALMASALFLFGDGDLRVEPTIESAAGYMEPIDLRNGEYDAVFDETGRRYAVDVVGETTRLTRTDESRSRRPPHTAPRLRRCLEPAPCCRGSERPMGHRHRDVAVRVGPSMAEAAEVVQPAAAWPRSEDQLIATVGGVRSAADVVRDLAVT